MILNLIGWCVFGLVVGAIARFLLPGRDPMGCLGTIIVGVLGSVVGGYLANLIQGGGDDWHAASFLGSLVGSILVLLIYRMVMKRNTPP